MKKGSSYQSQQVLIENFRSWANEHKEERSLQEASELTDKEYEILDTGPSHPSYHQVARKAERLGVSYAGPGSDKGDFTYKDKMSAYWRSGAYGIFLKQLETERGRAVIAERIPA